MSNLFVDSNGVTCLHHDSNNYRIISINRHNQGYLNLWKHKHLSVKEVRLETEGKDTFKCILVSGTKSTFLTPIVVVCIVERMP